MKGRCIMKTLETERLILRLWQKADVFDMFEYASDARVGPAAGWPVHENVETSKTIIRSFIKNNDVYAIVLKSENKVIGSLGIHERMPDESLANLKQKEIGYVLNPKYWGQGIVPEAVKCVIKHGFEDLGLDLIWCGYFSFNERSKRVVEKCRFNYKFTKNKTFSLLSNKEVEQHFYNITKQEYFVSKNES